MTITEKYIYIYMTLVFSARLFRHLAPGLEGRDNRPWVTPMVIPSEVALKHQCYSVLEMMAVMWVLSCTATIAENELQDNARECSSFSYRNGYFRACISLQMMTLVYRLYTLHCFLNPTQYSVLLTNCSSGVIFHVVLCIMYIYIYI